MVFGIEKAPLNTNIQLVGFESMMGLGRAYVLFMFAVNLLALQGICKLAAKGQTEFSEIVYASLAIQFCELILSAVGGHFLGVFSIIPIFLVTVLLLIGFCGMSLKCARNVGGIYYVYHLVSLVTIRLIANALK